MIETFDKLGLCSNLVEGLKKNTIIKPTPIQEQTIPLALENKDIIGRSMTGSGKTLAYLLPIFERIQTDKREMQAIILAPTHELVMQIFNEIKLLAKNSEMAVTSTSIIGEVNINRQIDNLKQKPHIIVGSPGRILELIKKRKINAQTVKTIVIDEGDRLLDDNNLEQVKAVIKTTLRDRQLMLFSATMNPAIIDRATELMKEPSLVMIEEKQAESSIEHLYLVSEQRKKFHELIRLLNAEAPEKTIVFLNKNEEIQMLTEKLVYNKLKAVCIFGNASKEERKKALEDFRKGRANILVASDIAARGLDITGITHVVNMDLPPTPKEYMHRAGRTGRVGKHGTCVSIATEIEIKMLKKLAKDFSLELIGTRLYEGKLYLL